MNNLPSTLDQALNQRSLISRFNNGRYDKSMKWAAELQFAKQIIVSNDQLMNCNPESIQTALLDAAYSGLSLSPSLAHAYLIPYNDVCQFSPGYRGLMHLSYSAGTIKSVQSNLVREHDPEFHVWTDEHGRHISHRESRGPRGQVSHSYVITNLTAGGPPLIEVMSPEQLAAVEKAATSRRKGGMVWRGPFRDEMCRKAVIRRASKYWPKDPGGVIEHMMTTVDRHDSVDFSEVQPDSQETEQELCISMDQQTMLNDALDELPVEMRPQWLKRYAERLGYNSIQNLPQRLFEKARTDLKEHVEQYLRSHRGEK